MLAEILTRLSVWDLKSQRSVTMWQMQLASWKDKGEEWSVTLKCLSGLKMKMQGKGKHKNIKEEWQTADTRNNKQRCQEGEKSSLHSRKEFTTTTRDEWEQKRIVWECWGERGRGTINPAYFTITVTESKSMPSEMPQYSRGMWYDD